MSQLLYLSLLNFLEGVKQVGKHLILKGLGLEEFFSGRVCDRERKPYSPSVDGWNNGMFVRFTYLKYLEFRNICIVLKSCCIRTEITVLY
jgi:hypothetical protein